MKDLYKILLIKTLFLLGCAPIKIRPVYLNPSPTAVYHKDYLVSFGVSPNSDQASWVTAEFQTWLNKNQDVDGGLLAHSYLYSGSGAEDDITSLNMFGFVRKWVTLKGRKNPLFNVYGGIQLSYNNYEEVINNKNFLTCGHIETGIVFGLYREKINLSLPLKMGAGVTYPNGYYIFMGPGLQFNFFPIKNLGVNLETNLNLGFGSIEDGAAIVAVPHFFKLSCVYKWR